MLKAGHFDYGNEWLCLDMMALSSQKSLFLLNDVLETDRERLVGSLVHKDASTYDLYLFTKIFQTPECSFSAESWLKDSVQSDEFIAL